MGPTSKSGTSNLGSRDTCSPAHCSICADFLISYPCQRQGSSSFCCLMKGQHSQLCKNSLQGTEKEEKPSCLQLKGRAERSQIICLLFLLQHDPDTLSLLPAVHSCGLPPSTTTWRQSEQEADLAENYSRKKKKYINGLKKKKIKPEPASWPVCKCWYRHWEGWGCTAEGPGWGGMRIQSYFSGGAWL